MIFAEKRDFGQIFRILLNFPGDSSESKKLSADAVHDVASPPAPSKNVLYAGYAVEKNKDVDKLWSPLRSVFKRCGSGAGFSALRGLCGGTAPTRPHTGR